MQERPIEEVRKPSQLALTRACNNSTTRDFPPSLQIGHAILWEAGVESRQMICIGPAG